jgi:hypothetical protein
MLGFEIINGGDDAAFTSFRAGSISRVASVMALMLSIMAVMLHDMLAHWKGISEHAKDVLSTETVGG